MIRQTWPMASAATVDSLLRAASVVRSGPGPLMSEAEDPSRVALVMSGTIVGTWDAPDGRTVYVGLFGPGLFMGVATLGDGPMTVGVDALTDVTLLVWEGRVFRQITFAETSMLVDLFDCAVFAVQVLNDRSRCSTSPVLGVASRRSWCDTSRSAAEGIPSCRAGS